MEFLSLLNFDIINVHIFILPLLVYYILLIHLHMTFLMYIYVKACRYLIYLLKFSCAKCLTETSIYNVNNNVCFFIKNTFLFSHIKYINIDLLIPVTSLD